MCEMLWSDPMAGVGRSPSKRGVGVAFGADVTSRFLRENDLGTIGAPHPPLVPPCLSQPLGAG